MQTALNQGIRAVCSLPRFGKIDLERYRKDVQIPSIMEIKEKILLTEAWKRRSFFYDQIQTGPVTRNRSRVNIPNKLLSGHQGKMTNNLLTSYWNKLPKNAKDETDKKTVRKFINSASRDQSRI